MNGTYKQFDIELYRENDKRARAAVAEYLNGQGLYCHPNEDKYGPDLCVYTGYKHKYYVETEVKLAYRPPQSGVPDNWRGEFPFPTVQIPERKLKFTRSGKPVEFWVLSADLQFAIVISEEVLCSAPLVEVPNSLVASGEQFIQVPIEQVQILNLREE
jgi:hypothetical protein